MSNVKFSIFPDERFVDLNLYQFGAEPCAPFHSYGPFARNHYLFHYIVSGKGRLQATDARGIDHGYDIHGGQGFLISPRQVTTYSADENDPWEYIWIEFDGLRVKEALDLAGLTTDHPIYMPATKDLAQQLRDTMLQIVDNGAAPPLQLIGHGFLFLDLLVRSSSNRREASGKRLRDFYLREAMTFIEQNYQNDISVEVIARFCNLNRSYFGKIFHETLGKSPQEFLITYRMTKGAYLLKTSDMSIKDIGIAVGYPNQLHFSRAFKSVYSISPKQWRSENFSGVL